MVQDVFSQLTVDSPMNFEQARTNMLKQQIRTWDVLDDKILALFYTIPREEFVPPKFKPLAFAEVSIPLGRGQSMMPPREEAKILQELNITPEDKILILGVDSGFLVTLLSKLGKQVFYIDDDLNSFEEVKNKLLKYKVTNVSPIIGNIHSGWQDIYPFNVILLTGSLPVIPESMKNALTLKGKLFVVVGQAPAMEAMIITRLSEQTWREKKVFETVRPRLLDVKEPESFTF